MAISRRHFLIVIFTIFLGLVFSSEASATDFTQFDVTRIRIVSIGTAGCPPTGADECVRIGVVVLFRQREGAIASISTQYFTGGTFFDDVRKDFKFRAPLVFRLAASSLKTAASGSDAELKKRAEKFLPKVNDKTSYALGDAIVLPIDTEQVLGKIADDYQRQTGKRLIVSSADGETLNVSSKDQTEPDKNVFKGAVNQTGGAAFTEDAANQVFRLQIKQLRLKLWVNAFIPGDIPNLTFKIAAPASPFFGKTAIAGPGIIAVDPNGGLNYLTDQRGFDGDPRQKHRMQMLVETNLNLATMQAFPDTDETTGVDPASGAAKCQKTASSSGIVIKNFTSENLPDSGGTRVNFTLNAAAGNPCVVTSPAIDWRFLVTVLWERAGGTVKLSMDGLIEPFPAFEMYASLNASAPTTVFTENPLSGSSPWNLPGNPNRAVTVVGKELP